MDDLFPGFDFNGLNISVSYPNLMKVISQEQDVDVHALIGNIGGYIGLFLGKILKAHIQKLSPYCSTHKLM